MNRPPHTEGIHIMHVKREKFEGQAGFGIWIPEEKPKQQTAKANVTVGSSHGRKPCVVGDDVIMVNVNMDRQVKTAAERKLPVKKKPEKKDGQK